MDEERIFKEIDALNKRLHSELLKLKEKVITLQVGVITLSIVMALILFFVLPSGGR